MTGALGDLVAELRRKPSYTRAREFVDRLPPSAGDRGLRIVLGGNCTTEFLMPGLRLGLAAAGYAAQVADTPFDGWIGEALSGSVEADVWVIWLSALGLAVGGSERRLAPYEGTGAAMRAIMARGQKVVLILPEATVDEADPLSPAVAWRRQVTQSLLDVVPDGAIVIDPGFVQRQLGESGWHALQYWSTAKVPCHPRAMTLMGLELAIVVGRAMTPRVRAVVVDLDDTLWGGIVGDLGSGGVALDPHGAGRPYLHLQRFLKDLSERGVPISIVSKNNLEDARAPFVERSEMILRLADIVCFEASWDHKYKAINRIAETLGLPLSALCFLDDSPHERAEARHFLPELIVPDLDEDPEERLTALTGSGLLWMPLISVEDRLRTAAYQSDHARREVAAGKSLDDYLRELDIRMEAFAIDRNTLDRVGALVQKTNQFNLTILRHGPAHLARLVGDPANYARCFAVRDRFGESGIVGVLIAIAAGRTAEIDTFLVSCRVLNRGIEFAMVEHFRRWAAARGVDHITAINLRSNKNQLTWDFLPRLGFAETASDGDRRNFVTDRLIVPPHLVTICEVSSDGF